MRVVTTTTLLVLVLTATLLPVVAAVSPAVPPPSIVSYAVPEGVTNRSVPYTLTANEPVTWTCSACPNGTLIVVNPSAQAGLHINETNAGSYAFKIEATSGATSAWQNWTFTAVKYPAITTVPSFYVTAGGTYRYVPVVANAGAGSWSFSGAPYLSLDSSTGTVYSSTGAVTAGTYTNSLVYHLGTHNYTQAWYTTTGSLPSSILVSARLYGRFFNATLPTSDVAVIGVNGIWDGVYPFFLFGAGSGSFALSWDGSQNYTYYQLYGAIHTESLYWYASPGTAPTVKLNGVSIGAGSAPASGFTNYTVSFSLPGAPTSLSGVPTRNSVALTWTNPTSGGVLVNQTVYGGTSCGSWTLYSTGGNTTHYTVTALAAYTTYCFTVAAWSAGGEGSVRHPYINATTLASLPGAPTGLTAGSITYTTVHLTWTNPTPSDGPLVNDTIYYGLSCGVWTHYVSAGVVTAYTVTGLSPGTGYCFEVGAWTSGGEGSLSSSASATTIANLSVSFVLSPPTPDAGSPVSFTSTVSGGVPSYTYAWAFGDGATSTAANPTHTYVTPGVYTGWLNVTGSDHVTASANRSITVHAAFSASFTTSPTSPQAGASVMFISSLSGGTSPYTYSWTFGDGGTSNLANPTHVYGGAGTYTAVLNASDADGVVANFSLRLTVSGGGGGGGGGGGNYLMVFVAVGLPQGTAWSVTIVAMYTGVQFYQNTTTLTITFSVPTGAYTYTLGPVVGYTAVNEQGVVHLGSSSQTVYATFTPPSAAVHPWYGFLQGSTPQILIGLFLLIVGTVIVLAGAFSRRRRNGGLIVLGAVLIGASVLLFVVT
jgi:PKD repeat protein